MDLHYFSPSTPCRSVLLTAKALGLELNKIEVNVMEGETKTEEFSAINPQHCIPTLVDGDFVLWESRAICRYLVNQNAEDDTLYPKDPKDRARVDFYMDFDMGTLYHRMMKYVYPYFAGSVPEPDKLEKVQEALGWLNSYLEEKEYLVGDNITIADFVMVSTVSSLAEIGVDLADHGNVADWLGRCQENMEGYAEENGEGAAQFGEFIKAKMEAE